MDSPFSSTMGIREEVNKVEGTSAGLELKLISSGFTKVYVLKGGWKEWSKSGYPVEPT